MLSFSLYETIRDILECLFIFLLIAILNPILIVPTLLIFGLLWMLRQYYIPTSRALKRIDATSKINISAQALFENVLNNTLFTNSKKSVSELPDRHLSRIIDSASSKSSVCTYKGI